MNITKLLVKNILEHAHCYSWSLQGLGMLRLYLSPEVRLHVWDQSFAWPNASPIHTHPWDFTSHIIAGSLQNLIYKEIPQIHSNDQAFWKSKLICGAGGHLAGEPLRTFLELDACDQWSEGQTYTEMHDVIHASKPEQGTVTIVERTFGNRRNDEATVYWPYGENWGSAEPRRANYDEIREITSTALSKFFR